MTEIHFFTTALLAWFQLHGRHNLPWQQNPSPYRVWVSEIMLQQTQVSTVIEYYQRFMKRFSSIELLAQANQDEVLHFWSGLGYYARARHLHRCAQLICQQYHGKFPRDVEQLAALPGIGRSTAGAILSFSLQTRAPILDGNVKRVLTRYHAIEGTPTESVVAKHLWRLAEQHTPTEQYAEYNQAIMDLGATICTRRNPACLLCPVNTYCQAYRQSRPHDFPFSKKAKPRPQKATQILMIKNQHQQFLLEKRPPVGIWGGLWSFPECAVETDAAQWCRKNLNAEILSREEWSKFKHIFTHFDLTIYPVVLNVNYSSKQLMENTGKIWYKIADPLPGGVAAPMAKLLKQLKGDA